MKIKLDDKHFLNSDPYCYWITVLVENEKNPKKPYERRVSGYCNTIEDAFIDYIDKKIKSSNADKISKLCSQITKLKEEIHTFFENLKENEDEND